MIYENHYEKGTAVCILVGLSIACDCPFSSRVVQHECNDLDAPALFLLPLLNRSGSTASAEIS